jgi:hypothetical protein
MMGSEPLYFVHVVSEWFRQLEEPKQTVVLQLLRQQNYVDWFKEHHSAVLPAVTAYINFLNQEFRTKSESEVMDLLSEQGPVEPAVFEALAVVAKNLLRFYFESEGLREATHTEFSRIVTLVITDFFIERRNSTLSRRMQYLQVEDKKTVRDHYRIVVSLVQNFYHHNSTLQELESFMKQKMSFDDVQIKEFCDLLVKFRPEIDRFFILSQLAKITDFFEDIEIITD